MDIKQIKLALKPIKTEKEYERALSWIDQLFDAKKNSKEAELLEHISILVGDYEDKHYPIADPDPIALVKYAMEQLNLSQKDVAKYFGGANRASEVLNKKRPLTIQMIKNLHKGLHIPVEALIA
ncbi:transcriptional regulator [Candidatus Gracilibacteria bacterium]|nr:transcriptional regulator [Candidatus Gracilibacteria bacterium]